MKKICLYRKENENDSLRLQGRYDGIEEAQDAVKELTESEGNGTIFDYFYKEEDYEEITDRIKTYEDACKVLGVEPINEQNAKAQGFRPDEIARRNRLSALLLRFTFGTVRGQPIYRLIRTNFN